MTNTKSESKHDEATTELAETTICGIVMPISEIGDCGKQHWVEVKSIIEESIIDAACEPLLVSEGEEVGIIQKRIVQNLYTNEIVVCDVSCRNPNVMFELGMRLAFDKPTIVIKDDQTNYPFDTSPLEYIEYPRDLRFGQILAFKSLLTSKIKSTLKSASRSGRGTFLSSFGDIKSVKIKSTEITADEFVVDELKRIRDHLSRLDRRLYQKSSSPHAFSEGYRTKHEGRFSLCLGSIVPPERKDIMEYVMGQAGVEDARFRNLGTDHTHLDIKFEDAPLHVRNKWFDKIEDGVTRSFQIN